MKLNILIAGCLFAAAVAMPAAADESIYTAVLSGPNEEPPNTSPGTGAATVTIDPDLGTMRVQENFSGLVEGVTASHIHCCTTAPNAGLAGVATTTPTFTGFPSGVTAGDYDHTFDMTQASSYNPAFITANGGTIDGAFDALVAGINSGSAYANIHSSEFPGGEIRGFLAPIPEPETYAMLLAGLALISVMARRRRV
ncbi:CHRD domain-containing protein [Nitrosovibrio sp. Nv6]|uniref:CHRD domain-containing protein n=1 Tax=Nitrosovibrio sp. Nv6 TaxID=1855340 RepID=UPI0008B2102E|nr:CHRD domain-containing protein [Nitrosovibrio sp. Nv6]SEO51513.1 PEP-CTERM protein-sorting domain-containing protein [Nitrosovibrio sp. Nv6]